MMGCRFAAGTRDRLGDSAPVTSLSRARLAATVSILAAFTAASLPAQALQPKAAKVQTGVRVATISGGFLAGRMAAALRDDSSAASFFGAALKGSPANPDLLNRTFIALLSSGQMDAALRFADKMLVIDKDNAIAHLALGVKALKAGQFATARTHLDPLAKRPILELVAPLLASWSYVGAGNSAEAVKQADAIKGQDAFNVFKDFSTGEMLGYAGKRDEALARLKSAVERDPNAIRITEAYARLLIRMNRRVDAAALLKAYDTKLPRHPVINALMADIDAGRKVAPTIASAQQGAADVLISVAAPLAKQGGADYSLVFYQLALYLDANNAYALLGLADLYSDLKQPEKSVAAYERVPSADPLKRNAEIELGGALDQLDRTDEAVSHLKKIVVKNPRDLDAIISLGGIYQARKRFAEAADTFTKALEVIGPPAKVNWSTFYYRGIAYERTKQWPKAEADFKKALELFPDQPSVLNYLGYSWIDQGTHLDEGMAMIKKAVEQRPDDGYIVDSLGWAHFRIGQYDDAVKQLERAVALKASDPTINDHLGDAYWKVGRKLEATFQWHHARDSKPEPDDLVKIELKLKEGLKEEPPKASAEVPKTGNGG